MRIALLFCLGLSSFVFAATPGPHPSLLFSPPEVAAIRTRLAGPLKPVGDAVRSGVDAPFHGNGLPLTPDLSSPYFSDPRDVAESLAVFSFASAIWGSDPNDAIGQEANTLAHNYLVGVCNYSDWVFPNTQDSALPDLNSGHFLFAVAVAYDWIYGLLSPAERSQCQARMVIEGGKMYSAAMLPASNNSGWWISEYLQNHYWITTGSLGMAALAFSGEISAPTDAWLATARNSAGIIQQVLNLVPGGGWHEGDGYLEYGLDTFLPFSFASQRASGGVDYAQTQILFDYPKLRAFMSPPSAAHRQEYPVWGDYSGYQDNNALAPLAYAAHTRGDGLAAWDVAQYLSGQTQGRTGLFSFPPQLRGPVLAAIFMPDGVAATPPALAGAAWALDYGAADLSLLLFRSGWQEGGSLLAFKAGEYGGRGNFARLAVAGAPGGDLDWAHDHADDMGVWLFADGEWQTTEVPGYYPDNYTRLANSLLVDNAGQYGEGTRPCQSQGCTGFFQRKSQINASGSTSHYAFTWASGAQLYDASLGLTTFDRTVFFVDRQIPIIRDKVAGLGTHHYDVVFHAIDGISQDAQDSSWLKLAAKNDRVLGLKVLSPVNWGYTTENQTANNLSSFDPDGLMTAAMIHPATDTDAVTFLTALVPSRGSSWSSRPQVSPLDPLVADHGVKIMLGADEVDVVLNSSASEQSAIGDLAVLGMVGARRISGGQVVHAALAEGTRLGIGGNTWIEVLDGGATSVEVEPAGTSLAVSGDVQQVRVYAPTATSVTLNGAAVSFDRQGTFIVVPGSGQVSGGGDAGSAPDAGARAGADGGGGRGGDAGASADSGTGPSKTSDGGLAGVVPPGPAGSVHGSTHLLGCGCGTAGEVSAVALLALGLALASRRRAR